MAKHAAVLALVSLAACSPAPAYLGPTLLASPHPAIDVSAPFAVTWSAAVDVFAESTVPIETIDRASGLLVPASGIYFGGKNDSTYADCGSALQPSYERTIYQPVIPTMARYNVRIKGDSSRSTVVVNAVYLFDAIPCVSRGKLETQFEQAIKARSERRP